MKYSKKVFFLADKLCSVKIILKDQAYLINTARRFSFLKEGFPSVRIDVKCNCNGFLLADKLCSVKMIIHKKSLNAAGRFSFLDFLL